MLVLRRPVSFIFDVKLRTTIYSDNFFFQVQIVALPLPAAEDQSPERALQDARKHNKSCTTSLAHIKVMLKESKIGDPATYEVFYRNGCDINAARVELLRYNDYNDYLDRMQLRTGVRQSLRLAARLARNVQPVSLL